MSSPQRSPAAATPQPNATAPPVRDHATSYHPHPSYAHHPHYPSPGHPHTHHPPHPSQGYHPQAWHYPPPPHHGPPPPHYHTDKTTAARPPYHAAQLHPSGDSTASINVHSKPDASTADAPAPSRQGNNASASHESPSQPPQQPEQEFEEPKVDPMKQDFHFYATDNYDPILDNCKRKLHHANLLFPESEIYLSTTLLNATLIHNWEAAPQSTRSHYLKMEETDRKRFMSEDEVASRHCATLTARKRSPKQSGAGSAVGTKVVEGVGAARSFGLGEVVPQMVGALNDELEGGKRKRAV